MIQKRMMGRTGLRISELCLGTLNFGWKTDEKTAFAILDAYFAMGGNFIQSSSRSPELFLPSTATTVSEEIVGRWWRSRGLRRDDLFLVTRIHVRPRADGAGDDLNRIVRESVRDSLRRLRTSYLDMVIFDWNEGLAPMRATFEAIDLVVRAGLARYAGAGDFPTWRVVDGLGRAYLRNHSRMEALQADYSLLTRARFEPDAMAMCQEHRLAFFARSPLAGGFLARKFDLETRFTSIRRDRLMERYGNAHGEAAQAAVADVASRLEASSAQVALSWVLHNPAVTSAVIGVHSVAQLGELAHAGSIRLSDVDLEQLDHATAVEEVFIGPEVARSMPADLALN